jgi:hypothetical protein
MRQCNSHFDAVASPGNLVKRDMVGKIANQKNTKSYWFFPFIDNTFDIRVLNDIFEATAFITHRHLNGIRLHLKPYGDMRFGAPCVAMLHGIGGRLRHNGLEILDAVRCQAIHLRKGSRTDHGDTLIPQHCWENDFDRAICARLLHMIVIIKKYRMKKLLAITY